MLYVLYLEVSRFSWSICHCRSLLNFRCFLAFFKSAWIIRLAYVCAHVILVVGFFFLAPDQWPLPVLQLSCNYATVCDVWVFKRPNTVSILSQSKDLRRVSCRYKRSLAVFLMPENSFFFFLFYCMSYFHVRGVSQ